MTAQNNNIGFFHVVRVLTPEGSEAEKLTEKRRAA